MACQVHPGNPVLAFTLACWLAAPVAAQEPAPPRVAIMPVRGGQGLSAGDREHLRARSRAAVLSPDVRVADDAEVADAAACEDDACRRRSLAAHGVAYWLTTELEGRDRMYVVRTALWSVDDAEALAHAEERCVVCGRVELAELVAAQALTMRRFLSETDDDPAMLIVDARPRSARVEIDGTPIGRGRVSTQVAPGEHRVRVTAHGYDPQELTLPVTRGVTRTVEVRLTHPEVPGRLHRPLAIGALATGGVSLGVGVALMAADGRPVGRRCGADDPESFDADGDCRYVHQTFGAGAALTALGAGLASAAATLLLVDAKRRRRHEEAWGRRSKLRFGLGSGGLAIAF